MRAILPIGLSLALAACTQAAPDPRGVARDEVLLQVVATGRADSRPDQARFSAGVETIAGTAAEASARNNEVMNKVAGALERLGIGSDDLQTRQITLNRIDYGPNRGRFQANNVIEVRVREVAKAGEAIAATTEAGANVLSGPNLAVSDPEAASRSAYANAYKAARARADAYAGAAGLKVARVLTIRDSGEGGHYGPYPMDATVANEAAPPPVVAPPVRPGVNSSEVRVRADFALARD
ncbi:MAG: SIMPL domain-containing protein [Allosphingosinicella sp.]